MSFKTASPFGRDRPNKRRRYYVGKTKFSIMASLCGENCSRAFLCGYINVFVIAFRNIAKKRVRTRRRLITET